MTGLLALSFSLQIERFCLGVVTRDCMTAAGMVSGLFCFVLGRV
jgi:hypothetical protein